ncbi:MAG: DUF6503 family protein [Psychroserpens sp.]|uniref:DUF6503 family protein n=1 Tax=Psychroserpens sp. TaxID=2020870 RepID=UPI003C741191
MRFYTLILIIVLHFQSTIAQELNGPELLEKSIAYHDPNGKWATFNAQLHIVMESPNNTNRDSKVVINLPKSYFYVQSKRDNVMSSYTLNKEECTITLNGSNRISEADKKEHNLSCERAKMYKNYYTYLYGLPMKLKDDGTIIGQNIARKTFKGKDYLVLKASYEESVGSDVWFFYFNTETYAMEIYQFFKTDANGNLLKDSGEYIVLTETKTINTIKLPKNRAWYYNKDDVYLGTDILKD